MSHPVNDEIENLYEEGFVKLDKEFQTLICYEPEICHYCL